MNKQLLALIFLTSFMVMPLVSADPFNQTISPEDQATFDHILEPVLKIYNLVKYVATFIAVIVLLLAGANYIMSGSDPKKREGAKNMIMYVLIGLVIIWAAPLVVQFITG